MLWASQVAPGNENGLTLRVYGTKGGISWRQENPNLLWVTPFGQPPRLITRGGAGSGPEAGRVTRVPSGHPEGYLEGFANIYTEAARAIRAARAGKKARQGCHLPDRRGRAEGHGVHRGRGEVEQGRRQVGEGLARRFREWPGGAQGLPPATPRASRSRPRTPARRRAARSRAASSACRCARPAAAPPGPPACRPARTAAPAAGRSRSTPPSGIAGSGRCRAAGRCRSALPPAPARRRAPRSGRSRSARSRRRRSRSAAGNRGNGSSARTSARFQPEVDRAAGASPVEVSAIAFLRLLRRRQDVRRDRKRIIISRPCLAHEADQRRHEEGDDAELDRDQPDQAVQRKEDARRQRS